VIDPASDIFPQDLIQETLWTLALLIPRSDRSMVAWYKKIAAKNNLDASACICSQSRLEGRQIDRFHFWRERLTVLKLTFDEAELTSWTQ
jgi:hypothetical protein